ncbi:MAG: hydrogenase small subunit [Chloroflexi bacterium]|nr:hydrogenase small subunit [Chloroflexota bacterium]MBU1751381.1 hydrogenase small subunit [Chloroflexota bacterium]
MDNQSPIIDLLAERGVSRRQFLKFCGTMAAVLALPVGAAKTIATALATAPRLPVIWLEFQDCTGDSESFLRACRRPDPLVPGATDPSITDIVLDVLSVDYHETLMVPAGFMAEKSRADTLQSHAGQYICVVEGAIPTANNGGYCTIGGRTALSIVQEVCGQARATVAMGACAHDGGLAAAYPNPTGAVGVRDAVPGLANLVSLPGCPANVVNLVATIVYLITYNQLPSRDGSGRPTFAYHDEIHERCERHRYYERDQYVLAWGDQGHRQGWCLRRMGCKGPETKHNCPTVKWNDGTCWPIGAGHGCVGCASPHFWDQQTPFYAASGDD